MKEISTDVLIVGSGLVGLVAAYSLSSLNYKVTLVDKKNLNFKTSFKDTRTVAISEGSKMYLESLSLWKFIQPYAESIKTIKVYDRSPKNKIFFKNQEKTKKLGYVVKNKTLSQILIRQLKKFRNINIKYGFDLSDVQLSSTNSKAIFDTRVINSKLIIAADGKNSNIKKILGDRVFEKKYDENALVLTFLELCQQMAFCHSYIKLELPETKFLRLFNLDCIYGHAHLHRRRLRSIFRLKSW